MCYLGSSHPDISDLNTYVTPNIPANKWKDLGLELLCCSSAELNDIERDIQGTGQRVNRMFEMWLTRCDATWNELIVALEKIHLTQLADNIRKNFLSRTGNDMYSNTMYVQIFEGRKIFILDLLLIGEQTGTRDTCTACCICWQVFTFSIETVATCQTRPY